MKKVKPLARLRRLIEVKQSDVKSSQLQLHRKRLELDQQLQRLKLYREEYVQSLMDSNIAPLQMEDTKRFLQQLETSIDDTRLALDNQSQSEEALQSVASTLNSQQKSVERRLDLALHAAQSADDATASTAIPKSPYTRGSKIR